MVNSRSVSTNQSYMILILVLFTLEIQNLRGRKMFYFSTLADQSALGSYKTRSHQLGANCSCLKYMLVEIWNTLRQSNQNII